MTEQMGYRNVDRVYALASQGKFSKTDENGKYSVSIDTFKAKKEADKSAKNDYVVIVVEAKATV